MIKTMEHEIKREGQKLQRKKGFTNQEIDASERTAGAAKKASDALHGSWGYAEAAVEGERLDAATTAAAAKKVKGKAPKEPKIVVPKDLKPDKDPKVESFSDEQKKEHQKEEHKKEHKTQE